MYPEDRVLVGVVPKPSDFEIARSQHWYRVPLTNAPKGIHAEYVAFYFTKAFGEELQWAIHFYARRTGHELARRIDLLPDEPDHPRAQERYYKLQLGPMHQKEPPIVSTRWRRITFIHTTWDRFVAAREMSDLFSKDDIFVDRIYHTLRERGIDPKRDVLIREGREEYTVDILIPCRDGAVMLSTGQECPPGALTLVGDERRDMTAIESEIARRGGPLMVDLLS